ncbi:UDP-N-acetylmuramoyl-L-alanine--D-glutamate ligase [Synechococcus sp. PCC 6312]|uniref:UDP-N-acetylmuramoyl-L-alanine--D-glutamate ligase n=1 Tax=Synechococcus sp. (strain ATCC 27167 / PCC 6312) TaxID=195253 RepID=UPI00029F4CE4|nr:UDP-N-acetylmuramoyl-L-alanine--D-glutamate ligase [Synechococcus sp. PCC 6312]AFY60023.1 UDP-N-acetylmuramoylalanine--D-glutamate ligase [Synechococcus sp. PCC 6312]
MPDSPLPVAHVIGLGKSGIAAAQLLQGQGWQVILSDRGQSATLEAQAKQLQSQGIQVLLNYSFTWPLAPEPKLIPPELVVISPGVPWHNPGLVAARQAGIPVIGEVELAWQTLRDIPWVGITGTNGKTTTTALTAAIFQAAGLQAPACGNIGYSICDVARSQKFQHQTLDWVIAEISSYQLESKPTLVPKIAIWTTLTPDHLERHGSLDNYCAAKCILLDQAQYQVLNGDDPYLRRNLVERYPQAWWTSTRGVGDLPNGGERGVYIQGGWVMTGSEKLFPATALKMPGVHNQQNLLLAVAAAHLAGISPEAMLTGISHFPGVAHRLEHIVTWQGIEFINDSKATNYDAAEIGLTAVSGPVILIAGGQSKKGEAQAWLQLIQQKVVQVFLIGDAAREFSELLTGVGYGAWENVQTLDQAMIKAKELAPQVKAKTILFSPACASFDQYRNFEERGDHFRQLCPHERTP